jgi:hypothetical protein
MISDIFSPKNVASGNLLSQEDEKEFFLKWLGVMK